MTEEFVQNHVKFLELFFVTVIKISSWFDDIYYVHNDRYGICNVHYDSYGIYHVHYDRYSICNVHYV